MSPSRLLTSEVARACAVSAQTVRLWEKAGLLRAERTATGMRLFDPQEVAALAEQRSRRVTPAPVVPDAALVGAR